MTSIDDVPYWLIEQSEDTSKPYNERESLRIAAEYLKDILGHRKIEYDDFKGGNP